MHSSFHRAPAWRGRVLAVLSAASMLLAACGSSGGDDSSSDTSAGNGSGAATTATAGGATTVPAGVSTIASSAPETDKIKRGGKLTYALDAESATGFNYLYSQVAPSGETVIRALYDPVTAIGEDGKVHPVLAESVTPNADGTQWVVKMRSGIKFHDGTPLDATALKEYIEAGRCSALVATAFGEFGGCPSTFDASKPEDPKTNRKPISSLFKAVTITDPMTVTIDLLAPFGVLDYSMAGYWLVSPSQVKDVANSPKNPIGTGPFKFKEWVVNDHVTVVKNPDYWLKAPDGQAYPYLDEITFKPIPDVAAREEAVRTGSVDAMMTSNGDTIKTFRAEKDDWTIFENSVGGETGHFMFNVGPTYKGKENPLADIRVRKGLALCTNRAELNELRNGDVAPVPSGPYPPGTDGYLEDTGFPEYDKAAGKAAIDAYKAEKGITGELPLDFGTTADPFNRGTNELVASYWKECGVNATVDQTEEGQYITRALVGDFQVFGWRSFGGLNPDRNFVWWNSAFAVDPPGVALNFGRMKDPEIDKNLATIRAGLDPAVRNAAAQAINKIFAEKVYDIWTQWAVWQIVADKKVQNIGGSWNAPDGAKIVNTARVSMHSVHSIWINS